MDVESNQKYAALTISSGSLINNYHAGEANYTNNDLQNKPIAIRPVPDSSLF